MGAVLSFSCSGVRPVPWLFFTRSQKCVQDQFNQQNSGRREENDLPLAETLLQEIEKLKIKLLSRG
jgi:hypothetical protein